jgi:hypothetical protein
MGIVEKAKVWKSHYTVIVREMSGGFRPDKRLIFCVIFVSYCTVFAYRLQERA